MKTHSTYFLPYLYLIALMFLCHGNANAVSLFQTGSTGARASEALPDEMTLNQNAIDQLRQTTGSFTLSDVPLITGASADFVLKPLPLFRPDTVLTIVKDGGATESVALPDIRTWSGTDSSDVSRGLFISADARGQIRLMVTGDSATSVTVIAPAGPDDGNAYEIVPANLPSFDFCQSAITTDFTDPALAQAMPQDSRDTRDNTLYEIEMMIDLGHHLYQNADGDIEAIAGQVIDLFGAVNVIYQRDLKARLTLTSFYLWSTPDPFYLNHPNDDSTAINTADQLYNYRDYLLANRTDVNRDLAHLLDYNPALGGIAYLGVLGRWSENFRCGISNVYFDRAFPSNTNVYFWDTMVVSHEIGHNVGSPHTHCYSPAIDCCAVEPGCSGCATAAPAAGTIMSYCHQQFRNGGSITMGFHPRCVTLMRPLIEASPILSPFVGYTDIAVTGDNGQIVAHESEPEAANGTKFPPIEPGNIPVSQNFLIKNNGTLELSLGGAAPVTVTGNAEFSISAQPTALTLAPGEQAAFSVQIEPSIKGYYAAVVTVASNDPDTPLFKFPVECRVFTAGTPVTVTRSGALPIPDNNIDGITIPFVYADFTDPVGKVNVRINGNNCSDSAQTGLEHSFVGDLSMRLTSPAGTSIVVFNRPGSGSNGSSGDNFCNTLFDDNPANAKIESITSSGAPYNGAYTPDQPLSTFVGETANGEWQLKVWDKEPGNTGTARSISLIIAGIPGPTAVTGWSLYD